jgi:hypothetical protein
VCVRTLVAWMVGSPATDGCRQLLHVRVPQTRALGLEQNFMVYLHQTSTAQWLLPQTGVRAVHFPEYVANRQGQPSRCLHAPDTAHNMYSCHQLYTQLPADS